MAPTSVSQSDAIFHRNLRSGGGSIIGRPLLEIVEQKGVLEKTIVKHNGSVYVNDSVGFEIWEVKDVKLLSEDDQKLILEFANGQLSGILNLEKNKVKL